MVEWFKWGSEYGRDLKTAAIKAGKIVKAQGGTISFGELGIEGIGAITDRNPKRAQLRIIQMYNPMTDDYHTGIRTVDDILSWRDVFEDTKNWVTYPDWDEEDIKRVLNERSVTIYSSYPIKNGVFVTPSRMNAEDYAGGRENIC
ncbi:hypothetical protein J6A32_07335 [Methanocorpusculum sp.]|nr:hypothetical protein [Methanocorpusculum sp.]